MHLIKDSSSSMKSESLSTDSRSLSPNFNNGGCQGAHTNQSKASSLKFSGMNLGDVMKVTVMEEMKILKMTKDTPLDLSVKNKFQSWIWKDEKCFDCPEWVWMLRATVWMVFSIYSTTKYIYSMRTKRDLVNKPIAIVVYRTLLQLLIFRRVTNPSPNSQENGQWLTLTHMDRNSDWRTSRAALSNITI